MYRIDGGRVAVAQRGKVAIELFGVPRNRHSEIAIQGFNGLIEVRQVTPAQSSSDIDWGAIALSDSNATIQVDLSVTEPKTLPSDLDRPRGAHMLIKSDRSIVFSGVVDDAGHLRSVMSKDADDKPKLPPGEYYVGAGQYWRSWINQELWTTLKKPDAAQILRDAHWPKIIVPEKGELSAQVSLEEIAAAARKVRGF